MAKKTITRKKVEQEVPKELNEFLDEEVLSNDSEFLGEPDPAYVNQDYQGDAELEDDGTPLNLDGNEDLPFTADISDRLINSIFENKELGNEEKLLLEINQLQQELEEAFKENDKLKKQLLKFGVGTNAEGKVVNRFRRPVTDPNQRCYGEWGKIGNSPRNFTQG